MVIVLLVAGLAIGFASAQRAPSLDARRQAGLVVRPRAGARAGRPRRRARAVLARPGRLALQRLEEPHRPARHGDDLQRARPAHRGRQRPRALLERGDEDRQGAQGARRGRRGLRDRPPALPHRHPRRAPRPRLRRADAGRPRAGRPGASRWRSWRPGWPRPRARSGCGARRRRAPWTPERVGMATLLAICVVFGVHSLIDWTWFVPGNAVLALLCAGWLAGRGPTDEPIARRTPPRLAVREPWRIGLAVAAVAVAVVAAWASWQPQRAVAEGSDALGDRRGRQLPAGARADRPRRADQPAVGRPALPAGGDRARRRQHGRRAQRAAGGGAQAARQPGDVADAGRVRARRGRRSRRRSRPSARPSTSTRARRRRSASTCRPAAGSDPTDGGWPAAAQAVARRRGRRARVQPGPRGARAPTRSPRRRAPRAACAR